MVVWSIQDLDTKWRTSTCTVHLCYLFCMWVSTFFTFFSECWYFLLCAQQHANGYSIVAKSLGSESTSDQFSRSVVSDSLRPHDSQHARPPCPSPTPGVYSNSCPSSWWCHPAISSSVIPFSWLQNAFSQFNHFQPQFLHLQMCNNGTLIRLSWRLYERMHIKH